jgi:hypothetical protein
VLLIEGSSKFLRALPVVSLHAYLENVKGKAAGIYTVTA